MYRIFIHNMIMVIIVFSTGILALAESDPYEQPRKKMIKRQIAHRGIIDPLVLKAMTDVPRHLFVPESMKRRAYEDNPLPIREGQTISQPYIVALMTESLNLKGHERVLEIGTGSGYQAAVLSRIADQIYSIEIKEKLHLSSTQTLESIYPGKVVTRAGDGYYGWEEAAPFDCIMITAAVNHIPPPLLKQLKNGGRLILPLGNPFSYQNLVLVTKKDTDYTVKNITGVLFVPMTGQALKHKQ